MKIYILRHATAEDRRPHLTDRQRRLTAQGVRELDAALGGLRRLKVRPDEVLSSPYRRAWDTAVMAARLLAGGKNPAEMDALVPGGSAIRVWMELKKYAKARSLMLVGHEPLLSEFAAFLLNTPNLAINLKKSGLIRVDLESLHVNRPIGTLRWVLTARQLARMG